MVLRSTLNLRASSLLLIFIFTFSISSLSFGKSVRLEIVNSELISIAICIIFTSDKLCNNLSQLYIFIQSLLYILKLSFIICQPLIVSLVLVQIYFPCLYFSLYCYFPIFIGLIHFRTFPTFNPFIYFRKFESILFPHPIMRNNFFSDPIPYSVFTDTQMF